MRARLLFTSWLMLALLGCCCFATGQGCSDPGICTVGSLNSENTKDSVSVIDFTDAGLEQLLKVPYQREKYRLELSGIGSTGERDLQYLGVNLRGVIRLKKKMLLNVKVPITQASGPLGSNTGLGDITVSIQNTFYSGKSSRLSFTAGVVVPTGDANKSDNGFVLPMAYQTTLGAYGVLVGLSGAFKNWSGAIGYQQTLGRNGNQFDRDALVLDPAQPGYDELNRARRGFVSTTELGRGNDIMLRVERRINLSSRFSMVAGILPIQRIGQSERTQLNGERVEIEGSDGLTLNLTGGLRYSPNRKWLFRGNVGAPVVNREVRADGLMRRFVGIGSVAYRIW